MPQDNQTVTEKEILPWHRILVRSGFKAEKCAPIVIDDIPQNIDYLQVLIDHGQFGKLQGNLFFPHEPEIDQNLWLNTVEKLHSGAEGGFPEELVIMDTYMGGIVRWLNALDIHTSFSCDGHWSQPAVIEIRDGMERQLALWLLEGFGCSHIRASERAILFRIPRPSSDRTPIRRVRNRSPRHDIRVLLDIAEWLHDHQEQFKELLKMMREVITQRDNLCR